MPYESRVLDLSLPLLVTAQYRRFPHLLISLMCLLSLLVTGFTATAAPLQVFVRATENGQGFLHTRLGECYAVVPAHVLGGDPYATLIGANSQRSRGEADLLQTFGYDLAILRVSGELTNACADSFARAKGVGQRLTQNALGVVTSVNDDGTLSRRAAIVTDISLTHIRIRPKAERDQFFKGLSGSLFSLSDQEVAILLGVDPESGEGRALRFDRALETLQPFFGGFDSKPERSTTVPVKPKTPKELQQVAGDLAAASQGGKISAWNTEPLGKNYRYSHLIDPDEPVTVWYGTRQSTPVEVVFELAGDKAQAVSRGELIGAGVDPQRLVRDFEILASASARRGWISLASGTYIKGDSSKTVSFAPVRAKRVMLRIYSNWGDAEAVGLSGFRVFASD